MPENVARQEIGSIEPTRFLRALARGMPAYGTATLKRYVEDDLRAIAAWHPDIVIGDFRLSLYISARLAGKPYGAIANAYWSRRYWTGVDAPEVPPLSWLPRSIADATFRAVYPAAFALHALPFHRACKWYGVDSPGLDIRDVYTASDSTGFADVEAFYEPTPGAADAPIFVGPLAWEPPGVEPLPEFPDGPPIVFVSLGSSGTERGASARCSTRLRRFRCASSSRPRTAIGQSRLPANCIYAAEFVPYAAACADGRIGRVQWWGTGDVRCARRRSAVLALPTNLDQILNMRSIIR